MAYAAYMVLEREMFAYEQNRSEGYKQGPIKPFVQNGTRFKTQPVVYFWSLYLALLDYC